MARLEILKQELSALALNLGAFIVRKEDKAKGNIAPHGSRILIKLAKRLDSIESFQESRSSRSEDVKLAKSSYHVYYL